MTSSARPDDLDAFVRGSRAADDELRGEVARLRAAYAEFQDGTRWGRLDATSLINAVGQYVDLNEADARWVAQIAQAFRAAGGDGDLARLPDAAIAASLRAAGLTGGRTAVTFDDPVAYGFPPTSGFADDPVNTASGNLVAKVVDLGDLRRVYNSRSTVSGAFGPGWSSWADTRLHARPDGAEYSGPDGQRALFPRQGAGYGRVLGVAAEVVPADSGLDLRWFDGRVWRFDHTGRPRTADRLNLGWDGDRLTTIGAVTLTWTGDRITAAEGPGRRIGYRYDNGALTGTDDHRYELDDNGRVTAVIDADGVAEARNAYDTDGRVVEQVSRFGRRTRYVYLPGRVTVVGETDTYVHDEHGRLLAVTDGHGNTLRRTYDEWGNPVTVTDRNGAVTTMRWDDKGRLLRKGQFEYAYDDAGRLIRVVAATGPEVRYRYDGEERTPSEILDPEGGITRLDVRDGLVHRITDPDGVTVAFGFDGARNLISATDALGNTARVERDAAGRVTATISPLGRRHTFRYDHRGRLVEWRDPAGGTWRYEHSPAGRRIAVTDPAGARRETVYGPHGDAESAIDPLGRRTTVAYDDAGNPARLILPDGAKWDFTFDTLSRLVATTDPSGATWLREFDADGNQVAAIDPMGTRRTVTVGDDNRVTGLHDGLTGSGFEYDPLGRVTAHVRPDGAAARAEYDRCGRRTVIEGPDGGRTRIDYTAAGRVRRRISPSGRVTTFEHDAAGRTAARIDGAGRRVAFQRDADGALVAVLHGDGLTQTFAYDAAGRLTEREAPGRGRVRYEHDAAGRVVAVTDATGGTRRFEYDAAGRLIAAVDALGNRTAYERHPRGWITKVVDPLGAVTRFRHDESGRLVEQVDPVGGLTRYEYDQGGRLAARTDGAGRTIRWTYDTSGRVVTITGGDGPPLTFRRDRLGRPVTVTEGGSRVDLTWDRAGRLVSRSRDGMTVGHRYDLDGQRVALVHPDGSESTYSYDAGGRLAEVAHPVTGAITIRRDALGRMIAAESGQARLTWEYSGALRTAYTFESRAGRRTARLAHDAAGRIAGDGERSYRYDAAGQLVAAGETTFEYDAAGRLIREGDLTYVYDAAGRLLSRGDTRYEYDGAGRRIREGDRTYRWDALGRLTAAGALQLRHDPLGELAEVGGQQVFWDAGPAGMLCRLGDQPVLGVSTPWTVGDRQLTPDWQGTPDQRDPWGAPAREEPGVGYRGELEFAGLTWLRNRAYEPASRSFLSPDPLPPIPGTAWEGNPYSYAGNDPLGHADPLGLRPVTDAELAAYRDEMSSGAFEDAAEWVGDNWEYIAAGAMIVGGIAVMATGVGGPIGAAMIGGALVGMGGSAGIQKVTTGEVDWGRVAVDGVVGAVGGGVVGALGKTARMAAMNPAVREAVLSGAEAVVSGGVERGLTGGDIFNPKALASDLLSGGVLRSPAGKLGADQVPTDEMVRVYRFHTASDPSTLRSALDREPPAVQAAIRAQLDTPEKIYDRAQRHMGGDTGQSPFVSLLLDPQKGAATSDDWLRKIITGHPKHLAGLGDDVVRQAPDMSTFEVPKSRLIGPAPDNFLSRNETEVVWHGEDLADYKVDTVRNPWMKE